jgi:hypothetical protein
MEQEIRIKNTNKEPGEESIDEPGREPIKKPIKEPIKEPTKEPIKEPVKEPIKEPVKEPIEELVKEPIKEQVQEPIKEAAKEQVNEPNEEPIKEKLGNKINNIEEVTAIEDLMREHSVLNRILLIYENIIMRLKKKIFIDHRLIYVSALLIRKFVEDYHEQTEERYVFPILIKNKTYVDLIKELISQHKLGRDITAIILKLSKEEITDESRKILIENLEAFVVMYRFHESREDIEIFQEMKKFLTAKEYEEMGEQFEKEEENVLGKDGFSRVMKYVTTIEKKLDIYDISKISKIIKQKF